MSRFIEAAAEIANRGWTVLPYFLPVETLAALRAEAQQFWQQEDFQAAGIGRNDGYAIRTDIRSDYIHWLDEQTWTPAQKVYWRRISVWTMKPPWSSPTPSTLLHVYAAVKLRPLENRFAMFVWSEL